MIRYGTQLSIRAWMFGSAGSVNVLNDQRATGRKDLRDVGKYWQRQVKRQNGALLRMLQGMSVPITAVAMDLSGVSVLFCS